MPVARPQIWAVFSLQCAQLLRWVLRVPSEIGDLAARTRTAVELARTVEVVEFGADARDEWASVYPALSAGRPGLLGAVTARAEAQTMRLALMYALLDRSPKMRLEHLRADQLGRERTHSTGDRGSMVWPLWVNDAGSLTIQKLCSLARIAIRQHKIRLICVDYAQLISCQAREERERLTKVSNALRVLAKTTGVPVLAVSQLSRPRDGDANRRPNRFSLKESGVTSRLARTS